MNAEERTKEIFSQALERKSPGERENFLAEACKDEPEMRSQVESLLRAHEQAGDFLSQTIKLPPADFELEPPGTMIGRYKLLEKIGEGGFGVVYMAEQQEPVQRKVALKIIKPGMDTREVTARFEAERQALALMDHPNIARVLDGGATEAGRPYFVMELVRGTAVTDYCDQNNLTTTERLQLFMKVCHAVQHAHQKAVIHRDLKPSNILVTLHDGEPVPKVIDFGVAKALGQKLTERTLFTAFRQMIGTPAYMAPEQAEMSGVDIDTRSDIYSLGVLLYELLTGVTPFDREILAKAALDEIRRMIREREQVFDDLVAPVLISRPDARLAASLLRDQTEFFARRCRWQEAAAGATKAIEIHPADDSSYHLLAPLLVASGDLEGYREHCQRVLARFGQTKDPVVAERMAKDCLILPWSGTNSAAVAQLANTAVTLGKSHPFIPFFHFCKALAEYRQGNVANAVEWANKTLSEPGVGFRDVQACMVLAMAHYQLKHNDESRAALAKGVEIERAKAPRSDATDLGGDWGDWIIAHALMKEAKALIDGESTPGQGAP